MMDDESPLPSVTLDADLVGRERCFDAWREALRPFFDVEPLSDPLLAQERVSAWLLDKLIFSDVSFSPHSFSHHDRHCNDSNYLSLQFYTRGRMRGVIGDVPFEMAPGEIQIFDFSRSFHSVTEDCNVVGVIIPHEAVGYEPGRHPAHWSLPVTSSVGRFLADAFLALRKQMPDIRQHEATMLAQGFCGLLRGILLEEHTEQSDHRQFLAARRLEIRSYVERHLADADLSVERICREFGASRSSIYRDFAEVGGVKHYITERRLDRIFYQLHCATPSRGLVSELARRWGFEDAGHFSRLFRQRFGVPPSAFIEKRRSEHMSALGQLSAPFAANGRDMGIWIKGI